MQELQHDCPIGYDYCSATKKCVYDPEHCSEWKAKYDCQETVYCSDCRKCQASLRTKGIHANLIL